MKYELVASECEEDGHGEGRDDEDEDGASSSCSSSSSSSSGRGASSASRLRPPAALAGVCLSLATLPAVFALSLKSTRCADGPPLSAYGLAAAVALLAGLLELPSGSRAARRFFRYGAWERCAIGALAVFSSLCDATQPAQLRACEVADLALLGRWQDLWRLWTAPPPPMSLLLLIPLLLGYGLQLLLFVRAVALGGGRPGSVGEVLAGALARGALAAAPTAYFGLAFWAVAWGDLGVWARLKQGLTLLLALLALLREAVACAALARRAWGTLGSGLAAGLGLGLASWSGLMLLKLLGALGCAAHALDVLTGGCAVPLNP